MEMGAHLSNLRQATIARVLFRHSQLHPYKMIKTSLYLTQRGMGRTHDDVIHVSENNESRDLFDVQYITPDLRKSKRFTLTETRVLDYLSDILCALPIDMDPFENVQLTTAIHPIIFYHVSDMSRPDTRSTILDMIRTALRTDVRNQ